MKYVGIDWAYRKAQWCALAPGGELTGEGRLPAERDGLARLVLELGDEVKACLEMMSGALWVRDELTACGWQVEVADARKVKTVAPLAAKTDKVDARLLAELCRRGLVPALWLPSLEPTCARLTLAQDRQGLPVDWPILLSTRRGRTSRRLHHPLDRYANSAARTRSTLASFPLSALLYACLSFGWRAEPLSGCWVLGRG